jgi:hypothetical protein
MKASHCWQSKLVAFGVVDGTVVVVAAVVVDACVNGSGSCCFGYEIEVSAAGGGGGGDINGEPEESFSRGGRLSTLCRFD